MGTRSVTWRWLLWPLEWVLFGVFAGLVLVMFLVAVAAYWTLAGIVVIVECRRREQSGGQSA